MFDNIGGKIKTLAKVMCWAGIFGHISVGIILMFHYSILLGLAVCIVGSLVSWVGSFLTYGFGQLIENSDTIVYQNNNKTDDHRADNGFQNIPMPNPANTAVPYVSAYSDHKWRCASCGEMISSNPCPYCGK